MIENSFRVCGTNDPDKVRNDEFLKKIMISVKDKFADEEELLEDEDLFSCVSQADNDNIIILCSIA